MRLTNDGCPLRCVTSDATFERLPDDYADASRRFLDYEPWIDIMLGGAPVFTAKVTQLRGGGSALGVRMSHAVSDGQGFIEFLVAWAERAQGRDHPMGPPVFDRALLPPPPEMDRDAMTEMLKNEGFESVDPTLMLGRALVAGRVLVPDFLRFPPGNRLMVPVSKENLARITRRAGDGASPNEALSAHVWLELARLLGPEGGGFLRKGTVLEHVTVVTARGGKRGLPDMYFGNASVGVCTGRLEIGDENLRTVKQVRDAIKPGLTRALMRRSKFLMLTEATFKAGLSAFDFDINRFMEGNMVWCNNLTDIYLKLYRLDFGSGAPKLKAPARAQRHRADPVQPPRRRRAGGENGVEMFFNLPPKVMRSSGPRRPSPGSRGTKCDHPYTQHVGTELSKKLGTEKKKNRFSRSDTSRRTWTLRRALPDALPDARVRPETCPPRVPARRSTPPARTPPAAASAPAARCALARAWPPPPPRPRPIATWPS